MPGIGDLDGDRERVVGQPVFDRKREGEGIDGTRARIVAERKAREVRPGALDGEGLEPGEAVQAELVGDAVDPLLAVARPADDRIEDRTDVAPDRRIAWPEQIAPGDPPLARLGAEKRDRRARVAMC